MNILYIHGLDSKLKPEKRKILERYGEVYTPDINYYVNVDAVRSILEYASTKSIDVVMGSSMGGFAGYYVSKELNLPVLLFNPALKERSVEQHIPEVKENATSKMHIILGEVDEVVNPEGTLEFLEDELKNKRISTEIVKDLGHNIPVEVFEEKVLTFMDHLQNQLDRKDA